MYSQLCCQFHKWFSSLWELQTYNFKDLMSKQRLVVQGFSELIKINNTVALHMNFFIKFVNKSFLCLLFRLIKLSPPLTQTLTENSTTKSSAIWLRQRNRKGQHQFFQMPGKSLKHHSILLIMEQSTTTLSELGSKDLDKEIFICFLS